MSRRCMVTGKGVQTGNKVSHAKNRTRRRFLPNAKKVGVFSEALRRMVTVRATPSGLRTIEHKGGLDAWLTGTAPSKLPEEMRPVRERIKKALAKKAK